MSPEDRAEVESALHGVRETDSITMLDRLGVAAAAQELHHERAAALIAAMDAAAYASTLRQAFSAPA